MNKMLFRAAFVACLTSSGCANPMTRLFAKKPQPYDEYLAQRREKENQVASRLPPRNGPAPAVISDQLNAGNAALQRGSLAEAQTHFQAVLQRQPNHPTANHRLAVIADQQRDFARAERYYQTALAASPRDASLLNDIGYSYLMQSRHADAERYLNQSLQLNPTQTNAVNNLASVYLQRGQNDQALSLLRRTTSESEAQNRLAQLSRSSRPVVAQAGAIPPAGWPPNIPNRSNADWQNPTNGINSPKVAPANGLADGTAANIDPNLPDETRQVLLAMEVQRRKAITDRNAKVAAEKAQRDAAMRIARENELGRAGVIPAGIQRPGAAQFDPRGAVQIPNVLAQPQQLPAQQFPANDPSLGAGANGYGHWPNQPEYGNPPSNPAVAPLDTMPSWPPTGMPNSNSQQPAQQNSFGTPSFPNPGAGQFNPNGNPVDDPALAAARYGMSAGPGNLFPMTPHNTPAPNNGYPALPNSPTNLLPSGTSNNVMQVPYFNQPLPQFAPQSAPNGIHKIDQMPPSGFQSSATDPRFQSAAPNWNYSPSQFSPQEQFPPSAQYQTPNNFGVPNFAAPDPRQQASDFNQAATRGLNPNRAGENDRWIQGAAPNLGSPNAATPSTQNWIATPSGDQALSEYERLVQIHNAETNAIRQQLDSQRQLPASEFFFRSQSDGSAGSSRNAGPIITPGASAAPPPALPSRPASSPPANANAPDQWPHAR